MRPLLLRVELARLSRVCECGAFAQPLRPFAQSWQSEAPLCVRSQRELAHLDEDSDEIDRVCSSQIHLIFCFLLSDCLQTFYCLGKSKLFAAEIADKPPASDLSSIFKAPQHTQQNSPTRQVRLAMLNLNRSKTRRPLYLFGEARTSLLHQIADEQCIGCECARKLFIVDAMFA